MTRRDAGLMKDGGDRCPVGIFFLHEPVWIQPSAVCRELAGHLLCRTGADPWFSRTSVEAEGEWGDPPRNDRCPGNAQPRKVRHQQAICFVADESTEQVR